MERVRNADMRPKIKKIAYYAVVLGVLVGTALWLYFGFIYVPPDKRAANLKDETPGQKNQISTTINLKKPEIKHISQGRLRWRVKAEKVIADSKTGRTELHKTEGEVFGKDGRMLRFFAPLTVYDAEKKRVRILGRFQGEIGKPRLKIEGETLRWKETPRTLSAKNASMAMRGGSIRGDSVNIGLDSKIVDFKGNVKIVLPLKRKKISNEP